MSSGKCPKCDERIRDMKAIPADIKDKTRKWNGAFFLCPKCDTILSAGIDPLSMIEEIARRVKK